MINQIAKQQDLMAQELRQINAALTALAEQKKDIEHIIGNQEDFRSWLKGHETRLQKVEQKQAACQVENVKGDVDQLKKQPGNAALMFVYAVVIIIVTTVINQIITGG
ncbi:hypothetical protein [Desulfuromonas acetoxidans]|uniref:hypothetical protein n=1 Tax=Desulfuromonas acetoxidans TaxID=891 RepID=UPI00292EAC24|nr:hypothetical protein [Desulfuromonas acetoxidans]